MHTLQSTWGKINTQRTGQMAATERQNKEKHGEYSGVYYFPDLH